MFNFSLSLDPFSFFVGFLTATVFWWLMARARPLWNEVRAGLKEKSQVSQTRRSSSVEENHRRITLRRAQGMHLAAPLFALDEILQEPLLVAPPAVVEPEKPPAHEDIVSQTIPYLPAWPELAAVYRAATLTVPQVLSGDSNLVLIGQPGIGKTVALAHLASLAANRSEILGKYQDFIPFLVHVADLRLPVSDAKNSLNPIIDSASEHAPVLDLTRIPGFVQSTFRTGQALLIVDGFDELAAEGQQVTSDYFKLLLEAHPQTRIVTTGAPEYLDGLIGLGFAPLALIPWDSQRIDQFMERWGGLWAQYIAVEAWAQSGPGQIDPILLNNWLGSDNATLTPLELTLKTWGAYAGDSLGPHVLEAIATHIRRIAPSNTPLAALEALAMQVTLSGQPIFDPRKAREWVRSFEPDDEKPEGEADEQAASETQETTKPKKARKKEKIVPTPTPGLLGKMASSGLLATYPNNRMRFVHPVFKGYLAGRGLSTYKASEALLNQPDWSGKYLAMRYLAAHGDVSKIVQSMLEWSRLPMHRPLLAAARWLRDAPKDAPWRGKLFATLAAVLQTEGIPLNLRGQALAAFVTSNDPTVAALFRQLMTTYSFELVQLAALGAGALKDTKAVPVLKNVMEAPSLSARRAAVMALTAIGTNEALEAVTQTILSADEDLRRAAAESLANDRREGHAILKDGATHSDIMLRRAVVYGLARVDEPWSLDLLRNRRVEDDQWVVRNAAAEVLDWKSGFNPCIPHKLNPPSESPWVIEFAGKQGLGVSPGSPATDVLLLALKSDNPDARLAALPYLKRTPTEGIIAQLYSAMYADDPELREAVYTALWELGASGVKLPHPSQYGYT
jgi:HEAT repeat protein